MSCTRQHFHHLSHRSGDGREKGLWLPCESWACPHCSKRLAADWHGTMLPFLSALQTVVTLYLWRGTKKDWESRVRRAVRRAGGGAYRVHSRSGTVAVTNTPLEGSQPFEATPESVQALFEGIALSRGRPVAKCGAWPVPQHRPPSKGEWDEVGRGNAKPPDLRATLEEFGVEYREVATASGALFVWTVPPHWTPEWLHNFRGKVRLVRAKPSGTSQGEYSVARTDGWNLEIPAEAECWEIEQELKRRAG